MDPAHIDRLGAVFTHPVEIIEPPMEDAIHEIKARTVQVLGGFATWILAAENPRIGAWQVIYALGLPQATRPMTDVAAELGVERATISTGARKFCKAFNITPSPAMRSAKAVAAYRRRRNSQLKKK